MKTRSQPTRRPPHLAPHSVGEVEVLRVPLAELRNHLPSRAMSNIARLACSRSSWQLQQLRTLLRAHGFGEAEVHSALHSEERVLGSRAGSGDCRFLSHVTHSPPGKTWTGARHQVHHQSTNHLRGAHLSEARPVVWDPLSAQLLRTAPPASQKLARRWNAAVGSTHQVQHECSPPTRSLADGLPRPASASALRHPYSSTGLRPTSGAGLRPAASAAVLSSIGGTSASMVRRWS